MKFLDKIFGRAKTNDKPSLDISKQNQIESIVDDIPLSEKYPGMDEEQLYWLLEKKDDNDEELTDQEKKFLEDEGWAQLARTLQREHLLARSKAINELINNNYLPLENEHENPFKELITFTLQYFENYIKEKPVEAVVQLSRSFPLMHQFIHRQITKQNHAILIEDDFNEQEAYDEFLIFCKSYFLSFYPVKIERDMQIKRHFKNINNSLIQFIDSEQTD